MCISISIIFCNLNIGKNSFQAINELFKCNSLFDHRQSAYRKFHSSETILLSILDEYLNKLDNNSNI